jgi:hypothetical protein
MILGRVHELNQERKGKEPARSGKNTPRDDGHINRVDLPLMDRFLALLGRQTSRVDEDGPSVV